MAIYKPTLNFLNTINVDTKYSKSYLTDVRDALFLSTVKDIEPTVITEVTDLITLGFTSSDPMYKKVADAFGQGGIDNILIYGVDMVKATSMTPESVMEAYDNHVLATDYTILILDVVDMAKAQLWATAFKPLIDSKHLFLQFNTVTNTIAEINTFKTTNNLDNVSIFVTDNDTYTNNLDSIAWARVRNRDLGSYIVHSTEIRNVTKPDWTKTEQQNLKDMGLNFISNPIRGKFHIQNGLATSELPIEVHLYRLWEIRTLQERLTRLQIEKDKIPINDGGFAMIEATIKSVIFTAVNMGIAKTVNGDPFGVETRTDDNGNSVSYLLGSLALQFPTEEDIRNADFKFRYFHTLLDGIRHVDVSGYISQTGELIIGGEQ